MALASEVMFRALKKLHIWANELDGILEVGEHLWSWFNCSELNVPLGMRFFVSAELIVT